MKLKLSILFLAAAVCCITSSGSAQVKIKIPIVFTDSLFTGSADATDTTGPHALVTTFSDTIWFGIHDSATVCRDSLYTFSTHWTLYDTLPLIEDLTPPIALGGRDIRFIPYSNNQGCFGDGSKADIRKHTGPAQHDTLRFKTTPDLDATYFQREVFRWPPVLSQYFDSCSMRNVGGLRQVNVEMTKQSQFVSLMFNPDSFPNFNFRLILSGPKNPPTTPTVNLLTPPDGATDVPLASVSLTWTPSAGALFYRIQVSKEDPSFQDANLAANDSLGAGTTSKTLINLSQNTIYYWRVAVFTVGGVSYYQNPPFHFTTHPLTYTTTLLSPANNVTGVSATPLFRWHPTGAGATKFHLEVKSDTNSASFVFNDSTLIDTFKTVTLQNCLKYFWKARTFNAAGWGPFQTSWNNFRVTLATPATPVGVSPSDGQTGVSLTPTLSWTNDACGDSTRIQVTADTTGTPVYIYDSNVGGTSQQIGPLGQNTMYFWHLTAFNSKPSSSPTSGWSRFTTLLLPPTTPPLGLPNDLDSTVSLSPTLTWNGVPLADTYTLKVYKDAAFTQKVFDDSSLTSTSQLVNSLFNCTKYYWKVKAKNAAGSSPFTSARYFKTIKAVAGTSSLVSPANGLDHIPFNPRLIWTRPDVCTDYFIVTLSRDTSMSPVVSRDSTIDTTIVVGPLLALTKYYWKAAAFNKPQGTSGFNEFSFVVTDQTPPGQPVLRYPADGQGGLPLSFILRWDSTDKASTYRVQVALDSLFTLLLVNDSTVAQSGNPGKTIGPLLNSRTYWWRVNAKNVKGTSAYSSVFKFSTLAPPSAPTLISPSNGATNVTVSPTFLWAIPERADSYRLQIARDSTFVFIIKDDSNIVETSWQIGSQLLGLKKYYWRVFGKNTVGYGDTSLPFSFTTARIGAASWAVPLSICETGPACDTISFGITPGATYGIDIALGEYELPQPPPSGWFDVRFVDARPVSLIGEGLRMNWHPFRYYDQIDTFKVKFQPGLGSYPMILSWSDSLIRKICDSMVILDEYTGAIVHQRMDRVSEVPTSLSSLLIIEYGAFPIPLGVKPPPRELPKGFTLSQNYPNPFNPTTRFDFSTDRNSFVTITVYDVLGREIALIASESYSPGLYHAVWNGLNSQGQPMPSGIYYVRMLGRAESEESSPYSATRKIIMMK